VPCYYIFPPLPSPRLAWIHLVFFSKPDYSIASDVCSTCLTAVVFLVFYFILKHEGVVITLPSREYCLIRFELRARWSYCASLSKQVLNHSSLQYYPCLVNVLVRNVKLYLIMFLWFAFCSTRTITSRN
jgi:hypothetical protein